MKTREMMMITLDSSPASIPGSELLEKASLVLNHHLTEYRYEVDSYFLLPFRK